MSEMVERVRSALDKFDLDARFNDWTSDHAHGLPFEVTRVGSDEEDGPIVVARFASKQEAISYIDRERARAAIAAMREPAEAMIEAAYLATTDMGDRWEIADTSDWVESFKAAIDSALSPSGTETKP